MTSNAPVRTGIRGDVQPESREERGQVTADGLDIWMRLQQHLQPLFRHKMQQTSGGCHDRGLPGELEKHQSLAVGTAAPGAHAVISMPASDDLLSYQYRDVTSIREHAPEVPPAHRTLVSPASTGHQHVATSREAPTLLSGRWKDPPESPSAGSRHWPDDTARRSSPSEFPASALVFLPCSPLGRPPRGVSGRGAACGAGVRAASLPEPTGIPATIYPNGFERPVVRMLDSITGDLKQGTATARARRARASAAGVRAADSVARGRRYHVLGGSARGGGGGGATVLRKT